MSMGWTELIVIFCVVLLFFGSKRIPEVARALGRASREFKNARDSVVDEVKESIAEPEKQDGRTVSEPAVAGLRSERKMNASDAGFLTHLEALRQVLWRSVAAVGVLLVPASSRRRRCSAFSSGSPVRRISSSTISPRWSR